jgi:hypothetical protein
VKKENAHLYTHSETALKELGYHGIEEKLYTSDHPEVIEWTNFFDQRFKKKQIFERFEAAHPAPSLSRAVVIGTQWHRFSDEVPWVLCQAAAQVSSNRKRHYVIQTAFEELGMRDETQIHAEMFRATTHLVGVSRTDFERLKAVPEIGRALSFLKKRLTSYRSDAPVLGILLGLEVPAKENIETVFSGLCHEPSHDRLLTGTTFFKFHRCLELEHIRLTVSNFLRFCATDAERKAFTKGFDDGVEFWAKFWDGVSKALVREVKGKRAKS